MLNILLLTKKKRKKNRILFLIHETKKNTFSTIILCIAWNCSSISLHNPYWLAERLGKLCFVCRSPLTIWKLTKLSIGLSLLRGGQLSHNAVDIAMHYPVLCPCATVVQIKRLLTEAMTLPPTLWLFHRRWWWCTVTIIPRGTWLRLNERQSCLFSLSFSICVLFSPSQRRKGKRVEKMLSFFVRCCFCHCPRVSSVENPGKLLSLAFPATPPQADGDWSIKGCLRGVATRGICWKWRSFACRLKWGVVLFRVESKWNENRKIACFTHLFDFLIYITVIMWESRFIF